MLKFNIALLPKDDIWQQNFAAPCKSRCGEKSDGYLLGHRATALTYKVDVSDLRTSFIEEAITMRPALGRSTLNGVLTQQIA